MSPRCLTHVVGRRGPRDPIRASEKEESQGFSWQAWSTGTAPFGSPGLSPAYYRRGQGSKNKPSRSHGQEPIRTIKV